MLKRRPLDLELRYKSFVDDLKARFTSKAKKMPNRVWHDEELEVVYQFQYRGPTTTDTLSLDVEFSKRIGKASTTLSKLTKRVWVNTHLTIPTKITVRHVYKACVISTLLYGSESWTTYSTQERKLQVLHLRCLRRILGITWQDKVLNNDVLSRAGIPSMFTILLQFFAIFAGWAMFSGWMIDPSPRIYSTVNLPLGQGAEAAPATL